MLQGLAVLLFRSGFISVPMQLCEAMGRRITVNSAP